MQTILITIISCIVFGEISKCSVSAAETSGSQVMTKLSNLEAAIRDAEPAIREYREDIHRHGKLTTHEIADLLLTVRYIWRKGTVELPGLIRGIKSLSNNNSAGDLTNWLDYCIIVLRAINATIGTDDSIFQRERMDSKKFVAAIASFSTDFKDIRKSITNEVGKGSEAFPDKVAQVIFLKIQDIHTKYTSFMTAGLFV